MTKRTATPAAASAAAPVPQTAAQAPAPARDEYTGIGGTYVRDPLTGKRTRLAAPEAPQAPAQAEASTLNPES